jgi:transposase
MDEMHAVAGIDPHKNSATVAVIDSCGGRHGCRSFTIDAAGIEDLLGFLVESELVIDRIGIEGSAFLGRPLVLALTAAGYDTREVQANRTAERRSRRRRAKSDNEDAEAIARETLAHPDLPPAGKRRTPDVDWEALGAVRNWRESLVLQRVRLLTEAEAVLVILPVAVRSALPATSRVLPQLKALDDGRIDINGLSLADQIKVERLLASLTDITTLTARIKELDRKIPAVLDRLGCTLTTIHSIGAINAMELLVEIGDPCRFSTEAQFARWCGAAPVALSSGEGDGLPRRHRLDLGGNRAVNSILHGVHVTQVRCHPPARAYMARQIEQHKPKRSARRSHKRHLANVIIRQMWKDAGHLAASTEQVLPTAA